VGRTASAYSRMLLGLMAPPGFGNRIYEATIPISVTGIMSHIVFLTCF